MAVRLITFSLLTCILGAVFPGCGAQPRPGSVFISSGTIVVPHFRPTDYLDKKIAETFFPGRKKEIVSAGSTTSLLGVTGTLGINSWRDARKQGNLIAEELAVSESGRHDFIAHSQGCRIVLEGIYRYVFYHRPEKPQLFRVVLTSPKVKEGYLDKVVRKVKSLAPRIDLQILVIYNPGDWKCPLTSFPYWLFPSWTAEDVRESGVVKQICISYDASFLDHEWEQMLGFYTIRDNDPDEGKKKALNRFLQESVKSFLKGEEYKPDETFRREFKESGASACISVWTNTMRPVKK